MEQTQGIFVSKFYEMDPQFEDLVPSGTLLQNGMMVLLEDSMMRADPATLNSSSETHNRYEGERAREVNRWCEVTHLEVRKRFDYDDIGAVIGESSPIISFVAVYFDGTKKKRRYDASYAWLVKLDSIPKCTNPECPQAGDCELNDDFVRECVENF